MKTDRRILAWAVLASLGLVASLFVHFNAKKVAGPDPAPSMPQAVKIASPLVIWAYGEEANQLSLILPEFQRSYPDLDVRVIPKSWGEFPGAVLPTLAPRDLPDVIQIGSTWVAALADSQLLTPLEEKIRAGVVNREKMVPESWDLYRTAAGQFAIPWYIDVRALYYRSDIVPKPPATWDELRAIAKRIRTDENGDGKKDKFGMSLGYTDLQNFIMTFWSSGGELDNLQSTVLELAFDRYISVFKDEIAAFGPYEETRDAEACFSLGYTPMMVSGPWHIRQIEKDFSWISDSWTTAPLPRYEQAVSFIGGSGWAIPKGARNIEGAWNFIEYMSNVNRQCDWWKIAGALPANRGSWDTGILLSPRLAGFQHSLNGVRHPPVDARWSKTESIWSGIIQAACLGKIARKEALETLRSSAAWMQKSGDSQDGVGATGNEKSDSPKR